MKKTMSLMLLICLMICSIGYADSVIDLSSLSVEDLNQLRNDIDAELASRQGASDQAVNQPVYNKDGIVIYLDGDIEKDDFGAKVSLLIENNTNNLISLYPNAFTVNGFQLGDFDAPYSLCDELLSGNKVYSSMRFGIDKCGIKNVKEIKKIQFYCQVYGPYGKYQYCTDDIILEFN